MARSKRQALQRLAKISGQLLELRAEAVGVILEARDLGATHAEIAEAAGLSRQRVTQILGAAEQLRRKND